MTTILMLPYLVATTLLLTAADHWTTWVCLRNPISGWEVSEANPLACWLFDTLGLGPAILLDSAVTLVAVSLLVATSLVPRPAKSAFFGTVVVFTGWAVVNNVQAILTMGIDPFRGA